MRAFIAIDLPKDIRTTLGQKQTEFRTSLAPANPAGSKQDSNIRWTHPEGIHLTLRFLGEITDVQVKQISEALGDLNPFDDFEIEVKGFSAFPTVSRPRVLWAGVVAPQALAQLAKQVEDSMEKIGISRERREFNPHLTLARFRAPRPRPPLQALIEGNSELTLGSFEVSEFFLFESKLSSRGAEYRKVMKFPV